MSLKPWAEINLASFTLCQIVCSLQSTSNASRGMKMKIAWRTAGRKSWSKDAHIFYLSHKFLRITLSFNIPHKLSQNQPVKTVCTPVLHPVSMATVSFLRWRTTAGTIVSLLLLPQISPVSPWACRDFIIVPYFLHPCTINNTNN